MKRLSVILVMGWAMRLSLVGAMADYPEEIPFVPTPIEVVDRMLELAEVKKGDVVYDLGSGDDVSSSAPPRNMAPAASASRWTGH